jgi:hypothetical protein
MLYNIEDIQYDREEETSIMLYDSQAQKPASSSLKRAIY